MPKLFKILTTHSWHVVVQDDQSTRAPGNCLVFPHCACLALRAVANGNVLACYYLGIAKYLLMTFLTSHIVIGNTAQCTVLVVCAEVLWGFQFSLTIESSCAFAGQHMGGLLMWWWEVLSCIFLLLRKHHFKWHTRDWEEVIMWKRKRFKQVICTFEMKTSLVGSTSSAVEDQGWGW